MNNGYDDELRALYRAAAADEGPTRADRRAVRATLATAIAAGVQTAASAALGANSAALGANSAALGGSAALGANTATAGAALGIGAKLGTTGLVHTLLASKFLGGLLVGAVLGTGICATAYVVVPKTTVPTAAAAARERTTAQPLARQSRARATPESEPTLDQREPALDQREPALDQREPALDQPEPQLAAPNSPADGIRMDPLSPSRGALGIGDVHKGAAQSDQQRAATERAHAEEQLLRETAALGSVQAALNGKDPERALTLLREQEAAFAQGQLGEERAAARVLALCAAGRWAEANAARARFLASYPNSALAKRVQRSCEP